MNVLCNFSGPILDYLFDHKNYICLAGICRLLFVRKSSLSAFIFVTLNLVVIQVLFLTLVFADDGYKIAESALSEYNKKIKWITTSRFIKLQ